jgi:GNAT superfamily N-acetyltransferase
MLAVRQAAIPADRVEVQELFAEYLRWVCARIFDEYDGTFDAEEILVHDMETLNIFLPPRGHLFLAFEGGLLAGCGCVRRTGDHVAEIKRMYVRPSFRRKGIGRLLVTEAIKAAREARCLLLRLDSAGFMLDAHSLYRSCGFRDRPSYEESEIPPEYRKYWVFMELDLKAM